MKRFRTCMLSALLLACTTLMAQGPQQGQGRMMRSASERAKMETERLGESLGISDTQKAKLLEINLKYATKDSIRFANRDANTDRETMMKQMMAQRAEQAAEIKTILNDDQKVKYDNYLKEREMRRQGQGGNRGPGQGGPGGNRPE